jgi:hypothetical protein
MATTLAAAENSPLKKVRSALPEIELLKPNNSANLKYLGLSGSGFLKINC